MSTLEAQRRAWETRPVVRALYGRWYAQIGDELAPADGPTVELGCGIGSLKEQLPDVVATDVLPTPWTDEVVDAMALPYGDGTVGNLVMVDVFHHLPDPSAFLAEAQRVLMPGGRLVMVEPYCSPVSTRLYDWFHHEPVDLGVDPFSSAPQSQDDPWDANEALPTLAFFRQAERFERLFPGLAIHRRELMEWLCYPLSGGFSGRQLLPLRLLGVLSRLEAAIPLERVAALRCMVSVERRPSTTG